MFRRKIMDNLELHNAANSRESKQINEPNFDEDLESLQTSNLLTKSDNGLGEQLINVEELAPLVELCLRKLKVEEISDFEFNNNINVPFWSDFQGKKRAVNSENICSVFSKNYLAKEDGSCKISNNFYNLPLGIKNNNECDKSNSSCNNHQLEVDMTEVKSHENNLLKFLNSVEINILNNSSSISINKDFLKRDRQKLVNNHKFQEKGNSSACKDREAFHSLKFYKTFNNLNEKLEVKVEHIHSPSQFYVSFLNNTDSMLELKRKLKTLPKLHKLFKNKLTLSSKTSLSKKIGNFALYYSKCDEVWHRAKVTDWCYQFDDEFVSIFLLDVGESKITSAKYLEPMPEAIKKFPYFIQRCHLYGIGPVDVMSKKENSEWIKSSIELMLYWTETTNKIKIKIESLEESSYPASFPVTMWVEEKEESINELLIKIGLAKVDKSLQFLSKKGLMHFNKDITNVSELQNWNPMKEDFESYSNVYYLDINDPSAIIYGYNNTDYQRLCRQFINTGTCSKGNSCKKEHEMLNPLGYTTDKEEIYKSAFNFIPIPRLGDILQARVTCILGISSFYCVICNSNLEEKGETLFSLSKYMNSITNINQMKKLYIPPSIGQIVIGKFSVDNSWYRGKILEAEPENDAYLVYFVDYGNKEILTLAELRAIEPRYLHLPFQAVKCLLCGIESQRENLNEGLEYLTTKLMSDSLNIRVVSVLPGNETSLLVDAFDEKGNNIGRELISRNYALPKNEIIISNESKILPG